MNNPFLLFNDWFKDNIDSAPQEPYAMTVSTSADNKPSSRVVLLRKFDEKGFVFYTNLTSRKGKEIYNNPYVALNFFWPYLHRQIRIEGKIEKVTEKEADDYFASRPRGSQIGAWASKQSHIMAYEMELADRVKEITEKFKDGPVPRPPFWSGCRVIPNYFEFWQEGEYRLHTRLIYSKQNDIWEINRLFP